MAKQSIPTPEGVSIEVELAGVGSRALALALDLIIAGIALITVLSFASLLFSHVLPGFIGDFVQGFAAGFFALGLLLMLTGLAVKMDGASIGKRSLGLRVIGADGRPATALQHFLRTAALLLDVFFLFVGAIMMFFGSRPRRLGDLVAGTIVVRDSHDDLLLDPWLKADWGQREARALDLTPGIAARFDEADLALLRDIILRREMDPRAMRELHREAALAYCRRARVEPTSDPRRALKDIFLFLRESRGL